MLKIHNKPSNLTSRVSALSDAMDEDDELIQSINNDHKGADDIWELKNEPDVQGIDNFWNGVKNDLEKDPNWYSFSDE
mgnify:FL=1